MNYFIGIEDLAANALITLMSSDQEKRFVSYSDLEEYGNMVMQILTSKGKKAIFILSRKSTTVFFCDYSNIFEEIESNNQKGISLKEGVTVDDLIDRFRGYLSLDLLLAFTDHRSAEVLGVPA